MPKPVALVTVFSKKPALERILDEIEALPRPLVADWYVGTYGIGARMAADIAATGCRFAPVFAIQPRTTKIVRQGRIQH